MIAERRVRNNDPFGRRKIDGRASRSIDYQLYARCGTTQLALYCAGVLRTGKWKYWHLALGMPLKSSFLREYSSEYLTEYSSTR